MDPKAPAFVPMEFAAHDDPEGGRLPVIVHTKKQRTWDTRYVAQLAIGEHGTRRLETRSGACPGCDFVGFRVQGLAYAFGSPSDGTEGFLVLRPDRVEVERSMRAQGYGPMQDSTPFAPRVPVSMTRRALDRILGRRNA